MGPETRMEGEQNMFRCTLGGKQSNVLAHQTIVLYQESNVHLRNLSKLDFIGFIFGKLTYNMGTKEVCDNKKVRPQKTYR